jgi:hypothetical protein
MRRRLAQQGFGADHGFRWRGGEISRLEGLSDGITTTLTGVLLFIVLFYVYPMKFLFSMLFDQLFGDARAQAIEPRQVPLLMLVYGAGFIAVQLVFILLYLRAYRLADSLELDAYERLTTRAEIQGFGLNVSVGLASIAIVTIGGPDAAFWSGMAYMLVMPVQVLNGRLMGTRIRQAATTPRQ